MRTCETSFGGPQTTLCCGSRRDSCRTAGNRLQHLQGAYAEAREAQRALLLMQRLAFGVPAETIALADRLGALLFGLMRRYR